MKICLREKLNQQHREIEQEKARRLSVLVPLKSTFHSPEEQIFSRLATLIAFLENYPLEFFSNNPNRLIRPTTITLLGDGCFAISDCSQTEGALEKRLIEQILENNFTDLEIEDFHKYRYGDEYITDYCAWKVGEDRFFFRLKFKNPE